MTPLINKIIIWKVMRTLCSVVWGLCNYGGWLVVNAQSELQQEDCCETTNDNWSVRMSSATFTTCLNMSCQGGHHHHHCITGCASTYSKYAVNWKSPDLFFNSKFQPNAKESDAKDQHSFDIESRGFQRWAKSGAWESWWIWRKRKSVWNQD